MIKTNNIFVLKNMCLWNKGGTEMNVSMLRINLNVHTCVGIFGLIIMGRTVINRIV